MVTTATIRLKIFGFYALTAMPLPRHGEAGTKEKLGLLAQLVERPADGVNGNTTVCQSVIAGSIPVADSKHQMRE
jgi:hypothetical protein